MGTRTYYDRYIRSDAWKARRTLFLKANGKRCRGCGRTGIMEVHHKTYIRVGAELDSDLVVLCLDCHKGAHELHRTMPNTTLYQATDLYVDHMSKATRR